MLSDRHCRSVVVARMVEMVQPDLSGEGPVVDRTAEQSQNRIGSVEGTVEKPREM